MPISSPKKDRAKREREIDTFQSSHKKECFVLSCQMVREGDIEKTGNLHTSRPRYEEHI
jgi:hypothetical protein